MKSRIKATVICMAGRAGGGPMNVSRTLRDSIVDVLVTPKQRDAAYFIQSLHTHTITYIMRTSNLLHTGITYLDPMRELQLNNRERRIVILHVAWRGRERVGMNKVDDIMEQEV